MNKTGCCVWFTGLPAAGKTTIAKEIMIRLSSRGLIIDRLDGDVVRKSFCADLGFSKEDRDENISRNSYVASYLVSVDRIVLCAFVSPYEGARTKARGLIKNFVEVFVDAPLAVCEQRDAEDPNRLGMYAKARAGKITGFTGIDDPYEAPRSPELHLLTDKLTVSDCAREVIGFLEGRGYVDP